MATAVAGLSTATPTDVVDTTPKTKEDPPVCDNAQLQLVAELKEQFSKKKTPSWPAPKPFEKKDAPVKTMSTSPVKANDRLVLELKEHLSKKGSSSWSPEKLQAFEDKKKQQGKNLPSLNLTTVKSQRTSTSIDESSIANVLTLKKRFLKKSNRSYAQPRASWPVLSKTKQKKETAMPKRVPEKVNFVDETLNLSTGTESTETESHENDSAELEDVPIEDAPSETVSPPPPVKTVTFNSPPVLDEQPSITRAAAMLKSKPKTTTKKRYVTKKTVVKESAPAKVQIPKNALEYVLDAWGVDKMLGVDDETLYRAAVVNSRHQRSRSCDDIVKIQTSAADEFVDPFGKDADDFCLLDRLADLCDPNFELQDSVVYEEVEEVQEDQEEVMDDENGFDELVVWPKMESAMEKVDGVEETKQSEIDDDVQELEQLEVDLMNEMAMQKARQIWKKAQCIAKDPNKKKKKEKATDKESKFAKADVCNENISVEAARAIFEKALQKARIEKNASKVLLIKKKPSQKSAALAAFEKALRDSSSRRSSSKPVGIKKMAVSRKFTRNEKQLSPVLEMEDETCNVEKVLRTVENAVMDEEELQGIKIEDDDDTALEVMLNSICAVMQPSVEDIKESQDQETNQTLELLSTKDGFEQILTQVEGKLEDHGCLP